MFLLIIYLFFILLYLYIFTIKNRKRWFVIKIKRKYFHYFKLISVFYPRAPFSLFNLIFLILFLFLLCFNLFWFILFLYIFMFIIFLFRKGCSSLCRGSPRTTRPSIRRSSTSEVINYFLLISFKLVINYCVKIYFLLLLMFNWNYHGWK